MEGASRVDVEEEEPRVRGIPSAPTSVFGAVGVAERGPIGRAVLCTSPDRYREVFGGFTRESDLALAAMGFFENGGGQLWCVRTVHYVDPADPSTAAAVRSSGLLVGPGAAAAAELVGAALPLYLDDGDELVFALSGGPDLVVAFRGSPAFVPTTETGPFALVDGQTLTLVVDDGREQTVTFEAADFADIGAATLAEVTAVLNAQTHACKAIADGGGLEIISDTEGRSASIQVTGGDANGELAFPTDRRAGLGNVDDRRAVTLAEVRAAVAAIVADVEVAIDDAGRLTLRTTATGAGAGLQVRAATAAGFGFDNDLHEGSDTAAAAAVRIEGRDPGTYADGLTVTVSPSSEADAFRLSVLEEGTVRESFGVVTLDPGSASYIERVLAEGSRLIRATDLGLPGVAILEPQSIALRGGDDGLAGLNDVDFIGDKPSKTGLHALDIVRDLAVLFVPGRASASMHNAMIRYCEVDRKAFVFAVLDPPAGMGAVDMTNYVERDAGLYQLSEHAAIYWPRLVVLNPSRSRLGLDRELVVPPSGVVCGVYARTDGSKDGGVYEPPAGEEVGRMFGVLGVENEEVLDEELRGLVFDKRINPLMADGVRYIDGARTLKSNGNFPSVSERRGVIFIERSVKAGLGFARHRNNDERLRAQVRRTVSAFLLTQMDNGAFRSRVPSKAFFVDVSDKLNNARVIFAGKLLVRMGLATQKPAEFVGLLVSQDTRAIEQELAEAGL